MMEITSLESEKRMGEVALRGQQTQLSRMLNGAMGKDMNDVLSGKKQVKLSFKQKIKYKIDNFLKLFFDKDNEYGI